MDELILHRVKECCVQLHSNVQKWKELSSRGFDFASQIVNLSIEKKYVDETPHQKLEASSNLQLKDKLDFKIIAQRETVLSKLKIIETELVKLVSNLGSLANSLKASAELCIANSPDVATPLFSTLPAVKFGVYAEELYRAYSQELSVKEDIIRDLLNQPDRDVLTVYLSCWLHEPYLTDHVTECLEALLIDCGLRS